jgi:hypothetical protein
VIKRNSTPPQNKRRKKAHNDYFANASYRSFIHSYQNQKYITTLPSATLTDREARPTGPRRRRIYVSRTQLPLTQPDAHMLNNAGQEGKIHLSSKAESMGDEKSGARLMGDRGKIKPSNAGQVMMTSKRGKSRILACKTKLRQERQLEKNRMHEKDKSPTRICFFFRSRVPVLTMRHPISLGRRRRRAIRAVGRSGWVHLAGTN